MKFNLSHIEKGLVISLLIELIIIFMLFHLGFQEKTKEETYSVEFIDDDFDFNQLQPEEKIELPDISKYIGKKYATNRASNALQEDKSYEEFRQHHENAIKEFYENRKNTETDLNLIEDNTQTPKKEIKKEVRFTGNSNIRYFIKNRYDIFIKNPLYTCPENMHGLVVIDIQVDRNGNVRTAHYNKKKSTTNANCLINSSIQATYQSVFNASISAPEIQKGYITYEY